jgi:hypothetical protein
MQQVDLEKMELSLDKMLRLGKQMYKEDLQDMKIYLKQNLINN